jgi:ribosomal subunit interface protein
MIIDIRAIGFTLTDAIVRHAEARVESALGALARWVQKVTVRVEDINSDRGGVDKRCSVVVALRRHGVEVAEATDSDLYRAIDEAASRIRRSVSRSVARHVYRQRREAPRASALAAR